MTRIQANLVLLLAAAIWGGGFVAQSTAMANIGPLWFVGLRFAIAAIAVSPLAIMETRKFEQPVTRSEIKAFVMVGLALSGGAISQQIGLLTTTVTNSSFLTGLYVVIVPVITVVFFRRAPHWIIWPASLMTLVGIFLLSGGSLSQLSSGDMLSILCAIFWAVQITLAGRAVMSSGRPLLLSCCQFIVCSAIALLMALSWEPVSMAAISASLGEILYVGIVSSGIAFVLQVIGQRYTTAPQAAIFLSSEALFGASLAAIILHETIPPAGYAGCAIIFVSMLLVEIVPELTRKRQNTAQV